METQADKKDFKETFRAFLNALDVFLDSQSVIQNSKIQILFIQEPQEISKDLYAKGVVQIGDFAYPVEIYFDRNLDIIKVESKVFYYRLKTSQMIEFVKEHGGGE